MDVWVAAQGLDVVGEMSAHLLATSLRRPLPREEASGGRHGRPLAKLSRTDTAGVLVGG